MELNIAELGSRVAIIGGMCSGKSTLAARLSAQLGLPSYHLDRIRWLPGGNDAKRSDAEYYADLQRWVAEERWIIDGSYVSALPAVLARAVSVIYLRPGRWVALIRYLRRLHDGAQLGICDGDVPKFYWSSIKYILWDQPRDKQPELIELLRHHPKVIVVR